MKSSSQGLRFVLYFFVCVLGVGVACTVILACAISVIDGCSCHLIGCVSLMFQEVDEFFEQEKTFLLDYYSKIKDATAKAEKMTRSHKSMVILKHI